MTEAIPAATLILFRERPGAPPQLLITERAAGMAFAGGALVFPGGRIDPEDHVAAADHPHLDSEEAAARIAALRETIEETGRDYSLAVSDLTPWARWRPNFKEARTFDTRFYIARVASDAPDPISDGAENVRAFWAGAAEVLAMCERGEGHIIFPTRRNLERLALFDSFDAALAHALAHAVEMITPWVEEREGGIHLCIPQHLGYPITSEPLERVRRG
ncbi:NUDIX domain-containing protein [Sphingomonas sp. ID1715]|uniref:NUDIX domain-containing protein n=1 Tax=Sphingomonas sp. ID1715 TaxID=1656898 RepID=UPI0014876F04|nr:NUDIX domain-containing protein [Sphingomonas sp. ID1715]NNM75925.1 NUDIX domain-containing protein [Sphingomonas sp. ID1715]